jgi:hypothetical protein
MVDFSSARALFQRRRRLFNLGFRQMIDGTAITTPCEHFTAAFVAVLTATNGCIVWQVLPCGEPGGRDEITPKCDLNHIVKSREDIGEADAARLFRERLS